MIKHQILRVSVSGYRFRDRIRVYRALLRFQRRYNRATPEVQERMFAHLMENGATVTERRS